MLPVNHFNSGIIAITLGLLSFFSLSAYAESTAETNFADLSTIVNKRLNMRMEQKLQQIIMEAQIVQNLQQQTIRNLISIQKEKDCESIKKLSTL